MVSSNFEFGWFARNPVPPDGKMVCAALVQQVCSYEEEWQRVFDRGDNDPDAVSVPCLTKEILVNIIRQCPVVETQSGQYGGGKDCRHYCPTWLLDNVGARFFTIEGLMRVSSAEVKHVRLRTHTIAGGITQADLGCINEAWSRVKPLSKQPPTRLRSPPQYFAPVLSLMRARHAVTTRPGRTQDDIWVALKALPPKFTVFLTELRKKPSDLLWLEQMMTTVPRGEQKSLLVHDWNSSLSTLDRYRESLQTAKGRPVRLCSISKNYSHPSETELPDSSSDTKQEGKPSFIKPHARYYDIRQANLKSKGQRAANTKNRITSWRKERSLETVRKIAEAHPSLVDPLLKAYK